MARSLRKIKEVIELLIECFHSVELLLFRVLLFLFFVAGLWKLLWAH